MSRWRRRALRRQSGGGGRAGAGRARSSHPSRGIDGWAARPLQAGRRGRRAPAVLLQAPHDAAVPFRAVVVTLEHSLRPGAHVQPDHVAGAAVLERRARAGGLRDLGERRVVGRAAVRVRAPVGGHAEVDGAVFLRIGLAVQLAPLVRRLEAEAAAVVVVLAQPAAVLLALAVQDHRAVRAVERVAHVRLGHRGRRGAARRRCPAASAAGREPPELPVRGDLEVLGARAGRRVAHAHATPVRLVPLVHLARGGLLAEPLARRLRQPVTADARLVGALHRVARLHAVEGLRHRRPGRDAEQCDERERDERRAHGRPKHERAARRARHGRRRRVGCHPGQARRRTAALL